MKLFKRVSRRSLTRAGGALMLAFVSVFGSPEHVEAIRSVVHETAPTHQDFSARLEEEGLTLDKE